MKYFIGEEFVKARRNNYASLPDMTIYYPCSGRGYEIWDIPGWNIAFADESIKKTAQIIETVDVCIFVMNHFNYLTNDEVTFLRKIREAVKDKPFIVAVNQIDERYFVDEEKSVAHILDYLRYRFECIDPLYKNIVLFGTSALQNFYLDKVVELAQADGLHVNADSIRQLKKNHRAYLLPIKFTADAMYNLEDFHDIEEPTDKELRTFSGVPQLNRYVNYLGERARHKNF